MSRHEDRAEPSRDSCTSAAELELLELKDLGFKVVLPSASHKPAAVPTVAVGTTREATTAAVTWDHLPSNLLRDLIELEELGGRPDWPDGLNARAARSALANRRQ